MGTEIVTVPVQSSRQAAGKKLPWVTILGVDGSGKSSVLRSLRERQQDLPIRRLHVFHRRPRLIHPARGPKGLPISHYGKPSHGTIKSIFKLAALVLDWHLGYRRQIRPLQSQGVLVIADRHSLLDILADPGRYRYGGPPALVRIAMRFAPMPDIVLLLDAPEDVLMERKQELDPVQMSRLRKNYLNLYRNWPRCHVIDSSRPLDEITSEILQILDESIPSYCER
jgi:thymidylate kinase